METFQDLSLPIPGKEDLAKLHSAIYQNTPAKPGACGDSYTAQGWLAFIVEYIRRYACLPGFPPSRLLETPDRSSPGRQQTMNGEVQAFAGPRADFGRVLTSGCARVAWVGWELPQPHWKGLGWVGPWIRRQVKMGVTRRQLERRAAAGEQAWPCGESSGHLSGALTVGHEARSTPA